MTNNILGLVLARGGSKGLPGKNMKLLGRKPLIAHTILEAKKSRGLDRIVVSTDCDTIGQIAKDFGVEVPFMRPEVLATDTASSLSGLKHAIDWLDHNDGYRPDAVFLLQPTSPFRQSWQIDQCIELYNNAPHDSVVGVKEVSEAHPLWTVKDESKLEWYLPGVRPNRRQDLPKLYTLNGAAYLTSVDYCKRATDPMPVYNEESATIYPMNSVTSLDINEPLDFSFAKTLLSEPGFSEWIRNPS